MSSLAEYKDGVVTISFDHKMLQIATNYLCEIDGIACKVVDSKLFAREFVDYMNSENIYRNCTNLEGALDMLVRKLLEDGPRGLSD